MECNCDKIIDDNVGVVKSVTILFTPISQNGIDQLDFNFFNENTYGAKFYPLEQIKRKTKMKMKRKYITVTLK